MTKPETKIRIYWSTLAGLLLLYLAFFGFTNIQQHLLYSQLQNYIQPSIRFLQETRGLLALQDHEMNRLANANQWDSLLLAQKKYADGIELWLNDLKTLYEIQPTNQALQTEYELLQSQFREQKNILEPVALAFERQQDSTQVPLTEAELKSIQQSSLEQFSTTVHRFEAILDNSLHKKREQQKDFLDELFLYQDLEWFSFVFLFVFFTGIWILGWLHIPKAFRNQLLEIRTLWQEALKTQDLPQNIQTPTDFINFARKTNQNILELRELTEILSQLQQGELEIPIEDWAIPEAAASHLKVIQNRLKQSQIQLMQRKEENQQLETKLQTMENDLTLKIQYLTDRLAAVESSIAVSESDPDGNIIYANSVFINLSGYSWEELLMQNYRILKSGEHPEDFYQDLWTILLSKQVWKGVFKNRRKDGSLYWLAATITPVIDHYGNLLKFILFGYDVSDIYLNLPKSQEPTIKEVVREVVKEVPVPVTVVTTNPSEIAELKRQYSELQQEYEKLRRSYENEKQAENRLLQQQAAIHELTKNSDLKEGNIFEGIKIVTETTVYTLDEERTGVWLFNEDYSALRCIDLFDRQNLYHQEGLEILREDFPKFFKATIRDEVNAISDVTSDFRTIDLNEPYFQHFNIKSILTAPVRLSGQVVGILMVEHVGSNREWKLDEVNFTFSVADLVTLALEQGNRKAIEEELRTSLEESQALEEELRQNSEEIEATNEEMRRTQIELRGQVDALNNAAIVSEASLQGYITYANDAFCKLYKYNKDEILGRSHSILRSGHHPPEFFKEMWQTIQAGNVWKGEIKNKSKDGWFYWINLTITPVIGVDGKPYKFISVGFDITAQKLQGEQIKAALEVALQQEELLRENAEELEAANEEMRQAQIELKGQINALNNSSMVYETDMEGNITYVNDELLKVSKYSREDL
ncbi:MAG: PAS domain S-box protein, partial [Bacteroidia bacterium]|nr:PAS domain S-box protein [Bacteroidia bacterium]